MLRIFKRRKFRQESNLIHIKRMLKDEFRFDDKASIDLKNGEVRFHYEFYEHQFAGYVQGQGFTAFIDPSYSVEVINYQILNDKFVDISQYDKVYRCKNMQEVIDTLEMIIEGEEEY